LLDVVKELWQKHVSKTVDKATKEQAKAICCGAFKQLYIQIFDE